MKLDKALSLTQVHLAHKAAPNRFHTMSFCGALLCLFTEMAVLLCSSRRIAFTGVSERLSSSNTSLGDRLGASTRSDGGIVLAHCSQNTESRVNVAEFFHGCCRQVVGVFPDEEVDHGCLQQLPADVPPPPDRWLPH